MLAIAKSKEELCSDIIFSTIAPTENEMTMTRGSAGFKDYTDNKSFVSKLDFIKSLKIKDKTTLIAVDGSKIAVLVRMPTKNMTNTMSAFGNMTQMSINTG